MVVVLSHDFEIHDQQFRVFTTLRFVPRKFSTDRYLGLSERLSREGIREEFSERVSQRAHSANAKHWNQTEKRHAAVEESRKVESEVDPIRKTAGFDVGIESRE